MPRKLALNLQGLAYYELNRGERLPVTNHIPKDRPTGFERQGRTFSCRFRDSPVNAALLSKGCLWPRIHATLPAHENARIATVCPPAPALHGAFRRQSAA